MDLKEFISLGLITEYFNQYFANWKITLPEEDLKNRKNGYIKECGWLIQYCFGKTKNGEYLDFYASHRMTDDRHHRIYADGKVEHLPALWPGYAYSPNDPEDEKRQKEKFEQHNEKVVKMMIEKGFT